MDRGEAIKALRFLHAVGAAIPAALDDKAGKGYTKLQEELLEIINDD
jgi:hypothetical protein